VIDKDIFLLENLWLPVLLGVVVLWGVFLWKEYRSGSKKWWFLKALIGLIAVIMLALMVLRPLVWENQVKGVGAILTQNYSERQLDSLKRLRKNLHLIAYEMDGLDQKQMDSITTAYILGDGMAPYDFWQLDNVKATYLPGNVLGGIKRLQYDSKVTLGDSLIVRGLYEKPLKGTQIVLEDSGGNGLDSLAIAKEEELIFEVGSTPKIAGTFVYTLITKDSLGEVVTRDPLPVQVNPSRVLKVVILNRFPTFETKYLKNFLAENGHQVLVRSQMTKDTYKFENFNRPQATLYNLTTDNLADFDLVILDGGSYANLSSSSRRALQAAVETQGLGVFIQLDESTLRGREVFGFRFKRNEEKEIRLPQWPKVNVSVGPVLFAENARLQPILEAENTLLSAYEQRGFGRVSTSMIVESYPLVLKGNLEQYAYIWSRILSAVSQKDIPIVRWETEDDMATPDVPFHFSLRTSMSQPTVINALGQPVALQQNVSLPDEWSGIVYPQEPGWETLKLAEDTTAVLRYYVATSTSWQGVKAYDWRQQNRLHFQDSKASAEMTKVQRLVSRLWFFIVFVFAMGLLWLLPRLEGN